MIKKFSLMVVLTAMLIFVSGNSQAEATEVFVGNFNDGSAVYLLTETVVLKSRTPYTFNCRVRVGYDYLNYFFYPVDGTPYYKNSEGYSGHVFGGQSPVAANVYRYVVSHY